jgi:hypothetical protein
MVKLDARGRARLMWHADVAMLILTMTTSTMIIPAMPNLASTVPIYVVMSANARVVNTIGKVRCVNEVAILNDSPPEGFVVGVPCY